MSGLGLNLTRCSVTSTRDKIVEGSFNRLTDSSCLYSWTPPAWRTFADGYSATYWGSSVVLNGVTTPPSPGTPPYTDYTSNLFGDDRSDIGCYFGNPLFTSNLNEIFPAGDNDLSWSGPAMLSTDGTKILVRVSTGVYYSVNSGADWTNIQPTGAPISVTATALSNEGSKMFVAGSRLYYSSNSGVAWTEVRPNGVDQDNNWASAAIAGNGTTFAVTFTDSVEGGNFIYSSVNSGVDWTNIQPSTTDGYNCLAISSDGSCIVATSNSNQIYTVNAGVDWTSLVPDPTFLTYPPGRTKMYAVACHISSNGSTLLIRGKSATYGSDYNAYLSTDSGANWTKLTPAGVPDVNLQSSAISADGSAILLGSDLFNFRGSGRAYYSSDVGSTWTEVQPHMGDWYEAGLSGNGYKAILGATYDGETAGTGRIYFGSLAYPPTPPVPPVPPVPSTGFVDIFDPTTKFESLGGNLYRDTKMNRNVVTSGGFIV